jgi:hypothetical protein
MSSVDLTEQALEKMARERNPEVIPSLVSTVRQQQHDLDSLRLALEVARRDREELRAALIAMQSRPEARDPQDAG